MGGVALLTRATNAGLTVMVEGDCLRIRGPRRAEAVAKTLLANKAEVLAALQSHGDTLSWTITDPGDLPSDWRIEWEERAAVREYDGGQTREHAEAEAFSEIVARMRAATEST